MTLSPETAWILIGLVIAGTMLAILRVTGFAYYNSVVWHNLRVEVHRLRIAQQRRMYDMAMGVLSESKDAASPKVAPPAVGTEVHEPAATNETSQAA